MRRSRHALPINRKSKMHPRWDGPFVILEIRDKNVATANGYILKHLVNKDRLQKLSESEAKSYVDEFWEASDRLKKHDALAKQRQRLNDLRYSTT